MNFRNEEPEYLSQNNTIYQKEIGNATLNTKLTFEYEIRNNDELKQMKIDIDQIKQIPF